MKNQEGGILLIHCEPHDDKFKKNLVEGFTFVMSQDKDLSAQQQYFDNLKGYSKNDSTSSLSFYYQVEYNTKYFNGSVII